MVADGSGKKRSVDGLDGQRSSSPDAKPGRESATTRLEVIAVEKFTCGECGEKASTADELELHIMNMHQLQGADLEQARQESVASSIRNFLGM